MLFLDNTVLVMGTEELTRFVEELRRYVDERN